MRVTSKGQVTIPKSVRDRAGIKLGTNVDVVFERGVVKIVRQKKSAAHGEDTQYSDWLKRVKGMATSDLTTDEILNMTRDAGHGHRTG
jgi:antitoxin PrlF